MIRTGKGAVKIGIDAPECVRVIRGELLEPEGLLGKTAVVESVGVSDGLEQQAV